MIVDSPARRALNIELDEHTLRIKQLLKDRKNTEENNSHLKMRCKDMEERVRFYQIDINRMKQLNGELGSSLRQLKQRYEIMLSDNSQLVRDNTNLTAKYNEIRQEFQNLRHNNFELDKERQDKEKIKKQIEYLQLKFRKEIQAQKLKYQTKHYNQLQILKNQYQAENKQIMINNLAKLQTTEKNCDRLNKQLIEFQKKYQQTTNQRYMLQKELISLQQTIQNSTMGLKSQLNQLHQEEIKQIKRAHQLFTNSLQNQIYKLQDALKQKNYRIELVQQEKKRLQILLQTQSQSKHKLQSFQYKVLELEDSLKKTAETNKQKIHQKNYQIQRLEEAQSKLDQQRQQQKLKYQHIILINKEDFIKERKILQKNIENLTKLLDNKQDEYFNKISSLKQLIKESQDKHQTQIKSQRQYFENKMLNLQNAIKETQDKVQKQIQKNYEQQVQYNDKINIINLENEKRKGEMQEKFEKELKEAQKKYGETYNRLLFVERQNEEFKDLVGLKQRQINDIKCLLKKQIERGSLLEQQIDRLRKEIIQNNGKLREITIDHENRIEKNHSMVIENMKIDYEGLLQSERRRNQQLKIKLQKQKRSNEQLIQLYKKMHDEIYCIAKQKADNGNIELKSEGATSELISIKNLFDSFLKTKLLNLSSNILSNNPGLQNQNTIHRQSF